MHTECKVITLTKKRVKYKVEVNLNSGSSEGERYTVEITEAGNQELRFYDNERNEKHSENTQKRIKEEVKNKT